MFVEILLNTDGYIGGVATFMKKPNVLNGKLFELNAEDTALFHKLLIARDGVELVDENEDVNIGGIKLKLNDLQNTKIKNIIKDEFEHIKTNNKADEFIKYINT